MLVAASFAFSEADADMNKRTQRKLVHYSKQRQLASNMQLAATLKNHRSDFSASCKHVMGHKTRAAKTFEMSRDAASHSLQVKSYCADTENMDG